jgi:hypothetical protein
MSTQHTPGPWWIDRADDVDLPNHVGISAEKHGLLAQVVWRMEGDERSPRREANARLIAAAPDLLEALLECLPHLERDDQHIDALGWKMPHYTKACEAIAKATGSKP